MNYVELFETVKIFTKQRFNMIEAEHDAIAVGILERFAKLVSVTVEVKPSVPLIACATTSLGGDAMPLVRAYIALGSNLGDR